MSYFLLLLPLINFKKSEGDSKVTILTKNVVITTPCMRDYDMLPFMSSSLTGVNSIFINILNAPRILGSASSLRSPISIVGKLVYI